MTNYQSAVNATKLKSMVQKTKFMALLNSLKPMRIQCMLSRTLRRNCIILSLNNYERGNPGIRRDILSVEKKGKELYGEFRTQRFVNKSTRLCHTTHTIHHHMETLKSLEPSNGSSSSRQKDTRKEIAEAQKVLDIAHM